MARAEPNRERIGDMLVAAGLVTSEQLGEALIAQQTSKVPIGKQLVSMGHVTELQLAQVLSHQLSVPWVSLERIEFSEALLRRVPGEICDQYCVMPIYVRHVRHQGATLYVAMDDPTHEEAMRRVSGASGLPVKPMIASPSDIRRAIEEHYFGGASAARSLPTARMQEASEGAEIASERGRASDPNVRAAPRVRPPPPPARTARTDAVVAVEQYETPSSPPGKPKTLTFLDGTQIALPASSTRRLTQDVTEVRHVIKAIRAANTDLGIDEMPRWHDVVKVLLDAFGQRGVHLTRKEVTEAWAHRKGSSSARKPSGE